MNDQGRNEKDSTETPPPFLLRHAGEVGLTAMALIWLGQWAYGDFDWDQIMLGIGTGAIVMAWAVDTTDNKTPEWLKTRPSPPRRSRKL